MGVGNHSYVNRRTGEQVYATRITRMNFKHPHGVPGARSTGDDRNEQYAISTKDGDCTARAGDWSVKTADGHFSVVPHVDFAAVYVPSPPRETPNAAA